MAAAREVFDVDAKLEALKLEILYTFNELYRSLVEHRDNLLSRLARMKEGHDRNVELEEAINQLRITKNTIQTTMISNLVGESLETMKEKLDRDIELKVAEKVAVDNLEFIKFCCFSGKIRKAIEETDLVKLIPEYVGRENPVLKRCCMGSGNGELNNSRGISIDKIKNELFISDRGNSRIQVLNLEGEYLRSFESDHLKEPFAICVSQDGVFVTDRASDCLLKFSLEAQFIKKTGSRGKKPGYFKGIKGLCYEAGFVYVCDSGIQRIQIFDLNLHFIQDFGSGEIKHPTDINIYSDTLYVLSQTENTIYCYNRDGTHLRKIELAGQEQQIILAIFFSIDKKGNFIISDHSNNEICIFSPKGLLKHILGRTHLRYLNGITLDNSNNIICVCSGIGNDCFQKY